MFKSDGVFDVKTAGNHSQRLLTLHRARTALCSPAWCLQGRRHPSGKLAPSSIGSKAGREKIDSQKRRLWASWEKRAALGLL